MISQYISGSPVSYSERCGEQRLLRVHRARNIRLACQQAWGHRVSPKNRNVLFAIPLACGEFVCCQPRSFLCPSARAPAGISSLSSWISAFVCPREFPIKASSTGCVYRLEGNSGCFEICTDCPFLQFVFIFPVKRKKICHAHSARLLAQTRHRRFLLSFSQYWRTAVKTTAVAESDQLGTNLMVPLADSLARRRRVDFRSQEAKFARRWPKIWIGPGPLFRSSASDECLSPPGSQTRSPAARIRPRIRKCIKTP